jgi:alkaline phosphatase
MTSAWTASAQTTITGLVMTSSLDAAITDSAPGMAAYVTGNKSSNHQEGVYPDNTDDPFDNPRVEYLGALLARTRGEGFRTGLVTTSDLTDATPAANAVHTANRGASQGIAARYLDERGTNGISVLLGGGWNHFLTEADGGQRADGRDLAGEFAAEGFDVLRTGADVRARLEGPPPGALLGLFHPSHMPVAFDKVGAGRYSDELALEANAPFRDQPMLEDMTRLALASLSAHAPDGFYLLVEGASIDKRAHDIDPERTIWDVIEFDRAIQVALDFAAETNGEDDPENDTLIVVTADHETGGMAVIAVGNERYAPAVVGPATRDYVSPYRLFPETSLNQFPNYEVDADGTLWTRTRRASWSSDGPRRRTATRTSSRTAGCCRRRSASREIRRWSSPTRRAAGRMTTATTGRWTDDGSRASWCRARWKTARSDAAPAMGVPPARRRSRRPSGTTRRRTCPCRPEAPARGSSPARSTTRRCSSRSCGPPPAATRIRSWSADSHRACASRRATVCRLSGVTAWNPLVLPEPLR